MLKLNRQTSALVLASLACLTNPLTVHGETKTIIAEATYTMGDGETPSFAEAQVLQRAKQLALEQAGTYVESYTKVQNLNLTTEEIQTIAGGVMTIEVLDKSRALVGDGLKLSIKIKATVTTDKMEELARRIKGKNVVGEYKKLQEEYARLSREVETWKQLAAKTPVGPEREKALDQIREREQAFARTQKNEEALFQRLVSGQALVAESLNKKALVDRLIESIKKDGHVVEMGKVRGFPVDVGDSKDRFTLTIPIILKPSAILPNLLTDAARSLGGDEVRAPPLPGSGMNSKDIAPLWERAKEMTYVLDGASTENRHVAVKTSPTWAGYYGLYSGAHSPNGSRYSIVTDATLIRLSHTRTVQEYFRNRILKLVFMVELSYDAPGFAPMSCSVPSIVNRLVSAWGSEAGDPPRFFVQQNVGENPVVLLLFDGVNFTIESELASPTAMKLDRVSARWVERQDAPRDMCRITVEKGLSHP